MLSDCGFHNIVPIFQHFLPTANQGAILRRYRARGIQPPEDLFAHLNQPLEDPPVEALLEADQGDGQDINGDGEGADVAQGPDSDAVADDQEADDQVAENTDPGDAVVDNIAHWES